MNLVARQNFGYKATGSLYNTAIGGVSATISTASLLATKLGISVGAISNFTIVGSDIQCRITGSYSIIAAAFDTNTSITNYYDYDGLVTSLGIQVFNNCNKVTFLYFPNCTSVTTNSLALVGVFTTIYIPRCSSMGTTAANNNVFGGTSHVAKLYCPISLQTNNSGSPDGDITTFISLGGSVSYVSNFTAPSAVTTLAAGTIYNTSIQLNFTPPSSTNTIDYYECYANGIFKNNITSSGGFINNLAQNTNYNITVYVVDVFLNKSLVSNILNQTTLNTGVLSLQEKTVGAYDLATNGNDAKGSYNGTVGSGATFASSECTFNGTSNAFVSVADADAFSFGNGTTDLPFSISMFMQFANKGTLSGYVPLSKSNNANNVNDEYYLTIYNNAMYWRLMDDNTIGSHIGFQYNIASLSNNTYYHFAFTYDGSKTYAGIKFYINGVVTTTTPFSNGTYTGMNNGTFPFKIGNDNSNSFGLNGKMKNVYVFNKELTQTEVTHLQTNNYPF